MLAYHFGLIQLAATERGHHPRLSTLDFPPELDDGSTVHDKENFVLEPFVALLDRPNLDGCQLIAAGNAFEGLDGANRLELIEVWG